MHAVCMPEGIPGMCVQVGMRSVVHGNMQAGAQHAAHMAQDWGPADASTDKHAGYAEDHTYKAKDH